MGQRTDKNPSRQRKMHVQIGEAVTSCWDNTEASLIGKLCGEAGGGLQSKLTLHPEREP